MNEIIMKIDSLLKKQCYIIDILPKQVPFDSKGKFFEVEDYLLSKGKKYQLSGKFANIIVKLMCYYPVSVFLHKNARLVENPNPKMVVHMIEKATDHLSFLVGEDSVLVFEKDCFSISVYNPNDELQKLISSLANSEGLFWRKISS